MIYTCITCDKTFKQKSGFTDHLNRKKPCIKLTKNVHQDPSNFPQISSVLHQITPTLHQITPKAENKCNYCGYKTERIDNYNRHKSSCKVKKQEISEKEEILNKLLEQNNKLELTNNKLALTIEELNKRIEKLENNNNKINHTQNNKNIKHQNNGISNTINIIGFGKEDLSKIDASFFEALMQLGYSIPTKMLEKIHNEK